MRPSAFLSGLDEAEAFSVDLHAAYEGGQAEVEAARRESMRPGMRFR